MKPMNLRQRWVLVTGASSGLGKELALQLAQVDQAHVVLVARRHDKLTALAETLSTHGVKTLVLTADLTRPDDVDQLVSRINEQGIELYGALLNAGVTHFGEHHALSWDESQVMLATNLQSVVRLTTLISEDMQRRRVDGGIMLVSSLAGSVPIPYQSLYSASKAFVTQFGQALSYELRPKGLSLTVFAPGGIATEMVETSGLGVYFQGNTALMPVRNCAQLALRAFRKRQTFAIPGRMNQLGALLARVFGLRASTCVVGSVYARALKAKAAAI